MKTFDLRVDGYQESEKSEFIVRRDNIIQNLIDRTNKMYLFYFLIISISFIRANYHHLSISNLIINFHLLN